MMHPVVEFEVAYREFGVVDVGIETVQLRLVKPPVLGDLGVEAFQRLEIKPLFCPENGLSEVQVALLPLGSVRSADGERGDEAEAQHDRPFHPGYQSFS